MTLAREGVEQRAEGQAPSWEAGGLIAGVLALAVWGPVLGGVDATQAAALVLTAGVVAGALALASLALRSVGYRAEDGVVAALLGFLGWPVLFRRGTAILDVPLPPELHAGLLLEALAVGFGVGIFWGFAQAHREAAFAWLDPVHATGAVGWGATGGAFLLLLLGTGTPREGAWTVLGVTLLTVAVALALQRVTAWRSQDPRITAVGSAPALVVAGSQLLDGVVSYLAVEDPLRVLAGQFQEEVALSAALLEATGPGYPIAKWAIAVLFAYSMDGIEPGSGSSISRLAAYLLVVLLGLGPGLFSASQLFL